MCVKERERERESWSKQITFLFTWAYQVAEHTQTWLSLNVNSLLNNRQDLYCYFVNSPWIDWITLLLSYTLQILFLSHLRKKMEPILFLNLTLLASTNSSLQLDLLSSVSKISSIYLPQSRGFLSLWHQVVFICSYQSCNTMS